MHVHLARSLTLSLWGTKGGPRNKGTPDSVSDGLCTLLFLKLNTEVLRKESCVGPGPCYHLHVACPKESHSGSLFPKLSHLEEEVGIGVMVRAPSKWTNGCLMKVGEVLGD